MTTTTIPDVDLTDGTFYASRDSHAAYRWMRMNQPVFRDRNGLPAVTTYQAILDAERNPTLFSNEGGIRPETPQMPYMIDMDDPAHLRRRKLVNAGFTRKRVEGQQQSIIDICDQLIDAVCERGECDFVRDLAAPLPMAVIGDMLGVLPQDRATLLKWSDDMMCGMSSHLDPAAMETVMQAFLDYSSYAMETIADRRRNPTDDLFSVLVSSEVDGQRLSDDEIVYETLLILIGGDETTRHTLSGGIEQLLRRRGQWDEVVADPGLLPRAIEEMLRWTSPVKNMCRTVTADTRWHGTDLRKGEKVLLMFESANFDETVFDDPESFHFDRNPNNHLAFGFGSHFCLGNQLARLEIRLMSNRLVQRLPDLRLADPAEVPLRLANFVSGPESMRVEFTPTAPVR